MQLTPGEGRLAPPATVKSLSYRLPSGQKLDIIANREGCFESVVLDADLAALCGDIISGALNLTQPLPPPGIDWRAVSLADETVLLERNNRACCTLVEIVLDELGDEIVAVEASKKVPECRNPLGFGDKLRLCVRCDVRASTRIHGAHNMLARSFEESLLMGSLPKRAEPRPWVPEIKTTGEGTLRGL